MRKFGPSEVGRGMLGGEMEWEHYFEGGLTTPRFRRRIALQKPPGFTVTYLSRAIVTQASSREFWQRPAASSVPCNDPDPMKLPNRVLKNSLPFPKFASNVSGHASRITSLF